MNLCVHLPARQLAFQIFELAGERFEFSTLISVLDRALVQSGLEVAELSLQRGTDVSGSCAKTDGAGATDL